MTMYKVVAQFRDGKFTSAQMSLGEAVREASDIVARTGNTTDVQIVEA